MARRLLAVALVAAALIGYLIWSQQREEPYRVSGVVEAFEVRLGSRVGGRVRAVHVEEGAPVVAGQLLLELEPYNLLEEHARAAALVRARRAELDKAEAGFRREEIGQAEARVEQLRARLARLKSGAREPELQAARALVEAARAEQDLAEQEERRARTLLERGTGSEDVRDKAVASLRAARARVAAREAELRLLEEGVRPEEIAEAAALLAEAGYALELLRTGARAEDRAAAAAALAEAEAQLRSIDRALEELRVVAPIGGIVETLDLEPGDLVSPNAPMLSLRRTDDLWVRAYVPASRLDVEVGRKVGVSADAFPGERFRGVVSFVAREAEFSPANIQTPEERSKQVYRIKVSLDGAATGAVGPASPTSASASAATSTSTPASTPAAASPAKPLRPGMTVDVWLDEP